MWYWKTYEFDPAYRGSRVTNTEKKVLPLVADQSFPPDSLRDKQLSSVEWWSFNHHLDPAFESR